MARDAGSGDSLTGLLPLVRWLCHHHDIAFAEPAFRNQLPAGFDATDRDALPRMLQACWLKSTETSGPLHKIDTSVLPVVVRDLSGAAHVLVGLDTRKGAAAVLDPGTGAVQELDLRALRKGYDKTYTLVSPESGKVLSRLDPATRAEAPQDGHWLWSAIARNTGAWGQVVLAALGMNLLGLALPIFVMNVYDRVIPNLAFVTLTTLAIGVALALLLDQVLRLLRAQVIEGLARKIDLQVASDLFRHALRVKLLSRPGGASAMISNIRDFETVREFFASATLVALIDLAFIGVFLLAMFWVVGPLAWVPIFGVLAILTVALLAQRPIRKAVDLAQTMSIKRHTVLVESLLNAETIKSLNAEPVMLREWEQAVAASSRVNALSRMWSTVTVSGTMFIQQAVSVGVIVWGVFLVADSVVTIGALIAANILAGRILAPMSQIAQTLFRSQYAWRSYKAIDAMMAAPIDRRAGLRSDLAVKAGQVALQGVSYTYPGAPRAALQDVTLEVAPGETIALLGRVGSGKTTIGRLIAGLIEPDSGLVLIDGHAAPQYDPAMLREGVGYLPQDAELFTGTLRENLMVGRADASDAEVTRALRLAGLDRFVAQSPEGLDHFVGEKGNRLSGGQRQCLALARVLLRRPKVLFLDEPTNALDHATEQVVIARLTELRKTGMGLILCTHRMSVAQVADRYVVIEDGRILLDGPREDVLTRLRSAQGGG